MHAVLCRGWGNRVKGRDWYDLIWFCKNKTPLHLEHFRERMVQSGHWDKKKALTIADLKTLLNTKISKLDIQKARQDVSPFIKTPSRLEIWSTEFFLSLVDQITTK